MTCYCRRASRPGLAQVLKHWTRNPSVRRSSPVDSGIVLSCVMEGTRPYRPSAKSGLVFLHSLLMWESCRLTGGFILFIFIIICVKLESSTICDVYTFSLQYYQEGQLKKSPVFQCLHLLMCKLLCSTTCNANRIWLLTATYAYNIKCGSIYFSSSITIRASWILIVV